ncbi:MAG: hypothetical protein JJE46_12040 [Acidimicrobiia bacterium]|nr:hypothetical protein [Acidimicrobiia bacterium]
MITRLRLGTKLGLLVLLPLLVVVGLGAPPVLDRWNTWKDTASGPADARLTVGLQRLLERLEGEASLSSRFVATGDTAVRRQLAAIRPRTDTAARALSNPAVRASTADARRSVRDIEARWRDVQSGRAAIDRRTIGDLAASSRYEPSIAATRAAITATTRTAPAGLGPSTVPPALRSALATLETTTAHQQAVLLAGIGRGSISNAAANAVRRDSTDEVALRDAILESLDHAGNRASTEAARELRAAATPLDAIRRLALAGPPNATLAGPWQRATDRQLTTIRSIVGSLDGRVRRVVDAARREARYDLIRTAAITTGAGVVALLIALGLRRAIKQPIRRVAAYAHAVAEPADTVTSAGDCADGPRPPTAPPIRTHDEIGDIDRALRDIDRTTADALATQERLQRHEIGDLYVTLARRNQPLLRRQLDTIGEIAHTEPDANRRAALSTLEHLASRMRRNAESLLVLAGIDGHRTDPGAAPLVDIAHDAVAEVEQFERVDVIGLPSGVTVTGRVAGDLTHVLAELIENAATYSAPDTRVFLSARRQLDGVEITVSDEGIGISVDRLDDINEVLSHPPLPGLDLSRSLGVIVIARLCERIGAQVSLRSAAEVGTAATLKLPARLIVTPTVGETDDDWVEHDRDGSITVDPRETRALLPLPDDPSGDEPELPVTPLVGTTPAATATFRNGSLLTPVVPSTPIPIPAEPARIPLPRRTPLTARPREAARPTPAPPAPRIRSAQAVFESVARYESGTRRAERTPPVANAAAPSDPAPAVSTPEPHEEGQST